MKQPQFVILQRALSQQNSKRRCLRFKEHTMLSQMLGEKQEEASARSQLVPSIRRQS